MTIKVVTGPPASGKSTWVRKHAQHGDIVIDYDHLANALTTPGGESHKHTAAVKAVTKAARQAAIDKALTLAADIDVYLIHSTPSPRLLDHYRAAGAEIITIDPGADVVMERAKLERPWQMQQVAKKWYRDQAAAKPLTRQQRGLGTKHEQQRKRLLAAHIEGTLCWWCGKPMYRTQELHADHTIARAKGGTEADRLLHGICNKQRGDGSRDHLRPSLPLEQTRPSLTSRNWLGDA